MGNFQVVYRESEEKKNSEQRFLNKYLEKDRPEKRSDRQVSEDRGRDGGWGTLKEVYQESQEEGRDLTKWPLEAESRKMTDASLKTDREMEGGALKKGSMERVRKRRMVRERAETLQTGLFRQRAETYP